MKARWTFIVAMGMLFGLGMRLQADDRVEGDRPDHYRPIDRKTLEDQVKLAQKGKLTPKDMAAISARVHDVSVLTLPDSSPDVLPASARPQGALTLDAVYGDPAARK